MDLKQCCATALPVIVVYNTFDVTFTNFVVRWLVGPYLVSETTTIISCNAPTPKLWFSLHTFVAYLGDMNLKPASGTRVISTR